jgi:DNA (cytosine-5)-methyltransferase 1
VFANDIDRTKAVIYRGNFEDDHLLVGDVALIRGQELPDIDLATASFPCTDLSLAGNRAGLHGPASSAFWEFARIIDELGARKPTVILLENVRGLGNSKDGQDLRAAIERLNSIGYWCDLLVLDAKRWVPQSRPRLFVVGSTTALAGADDWGPSELRPPWIAAFRSRFPDLALQAARLLLPQPAIVTMSAIVDRLETDDHHWWDKERASRFVESLSPIQLTRLQGLVSGRHLLWRTAYRRTRHGRPVWEIRADDISGCLRTARGGSSKQAVVEAGTGQFRVRWMSTLEYARLMGATKMRFDMVRENQALFGLGDAVCVPAVEWLAKAYLRPVLDGQVPAERALLATG